MNNDELLCPACGKRRFAQRGDNDICKYCGWENDEYFEAGGANTLSLADFRKRYQKYIELNVENVDYVLHFLTIYVNITLWRRFLKIGFENGDQNRR